MLAEKIGILPQHNDDAIDGRFPIRVLFEQQEERAEMFDQNSTVLFAASLVGSINFVDEELVPKHERDVAKDPQDEFLVLFDHGE